ncbi:MAG: DUF996 domain-containing protein, partial [Bacteroidales bacterium]|nr:DUF996 domain-containing protein [Bacteroidales bacterium]
IIPFLGALAGLASMILLLFSHYYFAKAYEKPEIFKKALTGTIIAVAGNIIGGIFITIGLGTAIFTSAETGMDLSNYQELMGQIFGSGISIFGAIIMLAAGIVGIFFVFKSLQTLAAQTNIKLFRTAGLLYLIGVITTIIFVGGIVMFVGWILHIIAYFSMQPEKQAAAV